MSLFAIAIRSRFLWYRSAEARVLMPVCNLSSASTSSTKPAEILDIENKIETTTAIDSNSMLDTDPIQDISRLRPYHRMVLRKEVVPDNMFPWQKERWAKRERFVQYGKASGVDPSILWPSKQELNEMKAEDVHFRPELQKTMKETERQKQDEAKHIKTRIREVEENLKKYPKLLKEYQDKIRAQEAAILEADQKREAKVREIQEYFGYAVDPSDPRFQSMLEKKEAEEKKAEKLAKRAAEKAKFIAQLKATAEAIQGQQLSTGDGRSTGEGSG